MSENPFAAAANRAQTQAKGMEQVMRVYGFYIKADMLLPEEVEALRQGVTFRVSKISKATVLPTIEVLNGLAYFVMPKEKPRRLYYGRRTAIEARVLLGLDPYEDPQD